VKRRSPFGKSFRKNVQKKLLQIIIYKYKLTPKETTSETGLVGLKDEQD